MTYAKNGQFTALFNAVYLTVTDWKDWTSRHCVTGDSEVIWLKISSLYTTLIMLMSLKEY